VRFAFPSIDVPSTSCRRPEHHNHVKNGGSEAIALCFGMWRRPRAILPGPGTLFQRFPFFEIEGFIYGVRAWIARPRRRAERERRRGWDHAGVCLASDHRWSRSVLVNASLHELSPSATYEWRSCRRCRGHACNCRCAPRGVPLIPARPVHSAAAFSSQPAHVIVPI
jgi:hypothetical protein